MTHPMKRGVLVTLLILAFFAPSTVAYAVWSNTALATVSVRVSSPPDLTTCTARKTTGPNGQSYATVNWVNEAGVTYEVLIRNTANVQTGISNGVEFPQGSLSNNSQLTVRGTTTSGSLTSTEYFDINFGAGNCVVKP